MFHFQNYLIDGKYIAQNYSKNRWRNVNEVPIGSFFGANTPTADLSIRVEPLPTELVPAKWSCWVED